MVTIWVRVLQRNRTNKIYIYIRYIDIYEIYYKELIHMIIKSQDLQSANWKPWKLMFQFESKGWGKKKKTINNVLVWRQSDRRSSLLLSLLVLFKLQLIGCGLPTLGKTICLTQSTDSYVNLIQTPSQTHSEKCLIEYLGTPWPKFTHKINHHNICPGQQASRLLLCKRRINLYLI